MGHSDYTRLTEAINKYAEQYSVSTEVIVVAWILRHPAQIQTIVGSMNPDRIARMAKAEQVILTRPEWYEIYRTVQAMFYHNPWLRR